MRNCSLGSRDIGVAAHTINIIPTTSVTLSGSRTSVGESTQSQRHLSCLLAVDASRAVANGISATAGLDVCIRRLANLGFVVTNTGSTTDYVTDSLTLRALNTVIDQLGEP